MSTIATSSYSNASLQSAYGLDRSAAETDTQSSTRQAQANEQSDARSVATARTDRDGDRDFAAESQESGELVGSGSSIAGQDVGGYLDTFI